MEPVIFFTFLILASPLWALDQSQTRFLPTEITLSGQPGTFSIDHMNGPGATTGTKSEIKGICSGTGILSVHLETTNPGTASIYVASVGTALSTVPPACKKENLPTPDSSAADLTVTTTPVDQCGRTGEIPSFQFVVTVVEDIDLPDSPTSLYSYTSTVTISCVATPGDAEEDVPIAEVTGAPVPGNIIQSIPFKLTKVASAVNIWQFEFEPVDQNDLGTKFFSIRSCTARAQQDPINNKKELITENGGTSCIQDSRTRVLDDGTGKLYTIDVVPFRFKNAPTSDIQMSCEAKICDGPAADCLVDDYCSAEKIKSSAQRSRRSVSPRFSSARSLIASVIVKH